METDYSKWNVKQLKDHLRSLCLPVSGNKPVLIQRIKSAKISQPNYSKMKVIELKELLKQRKLSTSGIKAELVERLEESDTRVKTSSSPKRKPSPKRQSSPKVSIPDLPQDIQKEILLKLGDKDLARACRTNEMAANICRTDFFWEQRLNHIFKTDIEKYMKIYEKIIKERLKPEKIVISYKALYMDMVKYPRPYLITASEIGDLVFIRGMLENEDFRKEAKYYTGNTARFAAKYGHLNIIKYLKDYIDSQKSYVLEGAVSEKQYHIANYMLNTYSFDDLSENSEEEVYYVDSIYIVAKDGNLPILKRLIELNVDLSEFVYSDVLEISREVAEMQGHEHIVEYLNTVMDE